MKIHAKLSAAWDEFDKGIKSPVDLLSIYTYMDRTFELSFKLVEYEQNYCLFILVVFNKERVYASMFLTSCKLNIILWSWFVSMVLVNIIVKKI